MSEHNHGHHGNGHGKRKKSVDELWKRLPKLTGEERIEALDILGRSSFDQEDYASAAIFAEETAKVWLAQNSKINAAMAFLNASVSWRCASYLDSSLEVLESAQKLIDEIVIPDSTGEVREILGDRLLDLGEYERAKAQFEFALKIFEESKDWHRCAHILQALSTAEGHLGEGTSSFASIDKALAYVVAEDFRPCCIGLVLQWVDTSISSGLIDPVQTTLKEIIESVSAFGDNFGSMQLKLRLAQVSNLLQDYELAFEVIGELEDEDNLTSNRYFLSKQYLQKAIALSGLEHNEEVALATSKARSFAKAVVDQDFLKEIDSFEISHLLQLNKSKEAERLLNRLHNSKWYQLHASALRNLEILRAHVLYRLDKNSQCLAQLDSLLQYELNQNQLLHVMAMRAQIVLESDNRNLARVLVGKSKEIAEVGNADFARMLFSLWYRVLEGEDKHAVLDTSKELVDIYLSDDIEGLSKKSLDYFLATVGGSNA
jgi:tetratricopeptide (TPR) repeat protein